MYGTNHNYSDRRWIQVRTKIISKDGGYCKVCYNECSAPHVHHKYYVDGNDIWDYPDDALATLCPSCHKQEHAVLNRNIAKLVVAIKKNFFAEDIETLAEGFNAFELPIPSEVFASALKDALSSKDTCKMLVDMMFTKLFKKDEKHE